MLAISTPLTGCTSKSGQIEDWQIRPWEDGGRFGTEIETEHFRVFSTIRDLEFVKELPSFLESLFAQYESFAPANQPNARRITLYAFGSRAEWTEYARLRFPERFSLYEKIRAGGFTENGQSVLFFRSRSETLAIIAHEGWHQYAQSQLRVTLPAWLNEGLACQFEGIEPTQAGWSINPTKNSFRINHLRRAVQQDQLLPLTSLVRWDTGDIFAMGNENLVQTYYAQVWSFVTFLRHGNNKNTKNAFDRLLQDISAGRFNATVTARKLTEKHTAGKLNVSAAFDAYFRVSPETLADEYKEYINTLTGFESSKN